MSRSLLPYNVPITAHYQDPEDSQRLWALGWWEPRNEYVFLTAFIHNTELWWPNWIGGETVEGFGVTPSRVTLWATMLADVEASRRPPV